MKDQILRKCLICSQPVREGDYCEVHLRSLENLRSGFAAWQRAYGTITIDEYFTRLTRLTEAGEHVKKMARYLQQNPEKWKTSQN